MAIEKSAKFPNFFVVEHPLVQHKLAILRDVNTNTKQFKELIKEIGMLLVYEVTRDLPTTKKMVQTPLETTKCISLAGKKPVVMPILRAGLGMVDGFLTMMPAAKVGHIGLYRDEETLEPHLYYFKVPPRSKNRHFYVCDPMLATGGSAIAAVNELKKRGIKRITFVCIVAAPEGVKNFHAAHPEIPIYSACLDKKLNKHGYILPGLGDAGDRIFGTK